jgi:LmbE family N-acetylglucosaminyl deacetylase
VLVKYVRRGAEVDGLFFTGPHCDSPGNDTLFHRLRKEGLPLRKLYYGTMLPERAVERGMEHEPNGQAKTLLDVTDTLSMKLAALRLHARHIADACEAVARL